MLSKVTEILSAYPNSLIELLNESYLKILKEFQKQEWQHFGNEIGQFIEIIRRLLEFKLTGEYTPINQSLKIFNEKILTVFEKNTSKTSDDTFRIIIPRVLYSMTCMRNKRGTIHINDIHPNVMDSTMLLYNAKWIFAELIRKETNISNNYAYNIIDKIIHRENSLVWCINGTYRIMSNNFTAQQKVLILLYIKNNQHINELLSSIEYKNKTNFAKIIKKLHDERLLEYKENFCVISPIGINEVEAAINNNTNFLC